MSHADRNLLFGILAVQANFVTRDALIRAMNAWTKERSKPLGRLLIEQQVLTSSSLLLLEQAVDERLAAHGGDGAKCLAATDELDALRAELERIGDPEIQATLDRVQAAGAATLHDREDVPTTSLEDSLTRETIGLCPPEACDRPASPPPPRASQGNITCEAPSITGAPALVSDDEPNRGDLLGRTISHYRVVERLGAGGMGVVYRAHDLALGRDAALKVLPAGFTSSLQARLLREAWASARVQHPGIATFYEAGEVGGVEFIAMEYVPGRTLRDRLREGPLPIDQGLALATSILEALAHAHAAGILHRDIKPANIMITGDGRPKLLDFGLAKPLVAEAPGTPAPATSDDFAITTPEGPGGAGASIETAQDLHHPATHRLSGGPGAATGAGVIAGSPGYMAPEQIRGEPVDVRTDIFAVGAVLYEVIQGRPAFSGSTLAECLSATLSRDPPPFGAPGLPSGLDRIVARALERDPSRRYSAVGEFLAELRRVGVNQAVPSRPDTLAILDFQGLGDEVESWIGGWIAEGLAADLARIPGLSIIPREAVQRARGSLMESDLGFGLYLGCRWLLSGSVRQSGPTLMIVARLTDISTGKLVADQGLEGPMDDLTKLLEELCEMIVARLDLTVPTTEAPPTLAPRIEAYRCYAQGRRLWLERGTLGAFDEVRELFERAVFHDPSYAPALASLSKLHAYRFNFTTESETLELAADYARRAIAADPRLAEARGYLGYVLMFQGNPIEAYDEVRQAMELDPTLALAPYLVGYILQQACDPGVASRLHQHLTGQPAPPDLHRWRRAEALTFWQRALALNPQFGWACVGTGGAHLELGHLSEARWCFERAVQVQTKALSSFPGAAGFLGECLRRMGELDEARRQCLAGLEAAERTDSMYRDAFRGVYLCSLGRTALQQGDLPAARAAFRQAELHMRGRPKARCAGHPFVRALAGATQAGEGPGPFEEALPLFERREAWNFQWIWGCSDDITLLELARAARTLGRDEDAHRLFERACAFGCTEVLDEL
jgi:serine/threonine protein kinase/tetratricopeptide (TPR) repeat protein